ncbi:hypothetical protein MP228_013005 [Amoeboaphelidium protococcarum]|nr:hypothetical protein MP228_013005 [Amoeboaphelidium protococcarum]
MSMVSKAKKIGTHSGTFHADESLACWMLKQTKEFADAEIVRSRDPSVLDRCDILVDVGGVYDPAKHRYDHHQREFNEFMSIGGTDYKVTKLSSAGLIYRHFGKEVLQSIMDDNSQIAGLTAGADYKANIDVVYKKVYDDFIEAMDAIDNGVSRYPDTVKGKYRESTHLSARVGRLNPWWNQDDSDMDERFARAMQICGEELRDRVLFISKAWLPARDLVKKALDERYKVDKSGKIMVFDQSLPWKEHLFDLEQGLDIYEERPLYALYPDQSNKWRVQCIPLQSEGFTNRKPLPESWRGLRDEALSQHIGIPGCIFVHAAGFIGGNATKEGTLQMAIKAVQS